MGIRKSRRNGEKGKKKKWGRRRIGRRKEEMGR
jgi:hypothetical protein